MNKTLMLIICDFLLLSMLALARFDTPEGEPAPRLEGKASAERSAEGELVKALEESLEAELESREDLSRDLSETRESLEAKARRLAEREAALESTRERLQTEERTAKELRESKARLAEERERIAEEKAALETRREELEAKVETTRSELEAANEERVELAKNVGDLKETATTARERLQRTREDLEAREVALAEREAALREAREQAEKLAGEREALNRRLEVARAERKLLEKNLTEEQKEKVALQREKEEAFARTERLTENVSELGQGVSRLDEGVSRLDKGVRTLSESSEKIREEMEEARPRTMSEIFTRFQNNRAVIRFTTTEGTLFGGTTEKTYESRSILVEGDDGVFLVTHAANTPFAFGRNHGNLRDVRLTLELGGREVSVGRIGFLSADPRLVFIPVPGSAVRGSGLETFRLARQPERWEEAVLVKNDESNFGRTGFRRLTTSKRFLKMDRPALGELFSEFASSRGDLAFSKNSRFIGVLADPKHAVVIDRFLAAGALELGDDFAPETADQTLDRLEDRLRKLPSEVR